MIGVHHDSGLGPVVRVKVPSLVLILLFRGLHHGGVLDIDKEGIILCGVHIGSRGELIAYDVVERIKSARRVLLDRHGVAGGDGLVVLHLVELLVIVRLVDVEGKVLHRL